MRNRCFRICLTLSLLAVPLACSGGGDGPDGGSDAAEGVDAGPASGSFLALTYNVHGLPSVITGDDTGGRMKRIGPLLNGFDIVGLQEDFVDDHHAVLAQACTLVTRTRFDDKLEKRAYGSGLATFARQELIAQDSGHYSTCHGLLDSASDCLASKGFLFNRLRLGAGAELDLYVTHLEAGSSAEDMASKETQVAEVLAFMAQRSQGRAVLFVGDFNLHYDKGGKQAELMDHIDKTAGLQRACVALGCPDSNHIDQHHYRSGDGLKLEAEVWRNEPAFFDPQGTPLSDHPAISVRYRWTRTGAP